MAPVKAATAVRAVVKGAATEALQAVVVAGKEAERRVVALLAAAMEVALAAIAGVA